MRAIFVIAAFWSLVSLSHAGTSAGDAQGNLPDAVKGKTLGDCVRQLDRQNGGWCSLGGSFFDTPASPRNLSYYESLKAWNDERSIFISWTGWAVDKARKKIYLLANGGHSDWLGNGVYEFDLTKGEWRRLRDPCRLTYTVTADRDAPYGFMKFDEGVTSTKIPDPDCGPASSHTYDGVQFSRKTGTVFWVSGIYGARGGEANFYSGKELWEFNPSETESRNGIPPLTWKRHSAINLPAGSGGWPTSVEYDDGWLGWEIASGRGKKFDPADPEGTITDARDMGIPYGEGAAVYDGARDTVWVAAQRHGILAVGPGGHSVYAKKATGFGHQPGLAMRKGKLVMWNGSNAVLTFEPDSKEYRVLDWTGKKPRAGNHNVYSKWTYLPDDDVFVGISVGQTGVLVYRPPEESGERASTTDPQQYIDAAKAGDTVTIPPGTYRKGIYIRKPLRVEMKGVRLTAPVGGKGVVVVNADGPVVLDGYTADVVPQCQTNCAGLRVEGTNYDVTLRNATILHQEMGILTGNKGGTLVIENSDIGETGTQHQSDLSHVIYVGWSDKLVIRNSRIHGSHRLGHLVKSRAAETVIEDSRILGEHTHHSRLVEIPCGGSLTIAGSTLQQSDKTDNAEFMLVGGGSLTNCSGHPNRPVSLKLINDRLITYRDKSSDEPARDAGPTGLMHWRAINQPVINKRNGNVRFSGNTNEMGADNTSSPIETLWYSNDTAPYPPPPVTVLRGD